MSLVVMQKIRLLTHTSVATEVLRVVQKEGVIEFTQVNNTSLEHYDPTKFEFNYVSARLDFAVDFLSEHGPERSGLAVALEGTQERVNEDRINEVVGSVYTTDVIDEAQTIQKELNDTIKKIQELEKERLALEPWKNARFIVGRDYQTDTTETYFLVRSGRKLTKKSTAIESHNELLTILGDDNIRYHDAIVDDTRLILTIMTEDCARAKEVLNTYQYEIVHMAQRRGTPIEEIERIDRALIKSQEKKEHLGERARSLAKDNLANLKILSDHTLWQKERHDAFVGAYRTKNVLVYEGWCISNHYDTLLRVLSDTTNLFSLERIEPDKEETPPVEIENNGILKPFEAVTRLYGLPGHCDLDPTPYLAGFFFVFFGFCLTDVGYGAILASVTGYLLWRYDVIENTKIMLELLFLGGVASFVAGIFFGGYLGLDMSRMPEVLQALQKFDPISNPMPVFYFALVLGVVQVMSGLLIALWRGKVYGEFKDALLDKGPWLFFFVALIVWGATKFDIVHFDNAVYFVYGALIAIVLTQGRKQKNVIMKVFMGIASLYDIVAYFSDVLSYSRLLALGLATSALSFAINLIADMVAGDEGSIGGMIAAGVILIIGHLFNLVINAFGAFIHSARLQFVEFFAKFITGTGRIFVPFKRKERNIVFRQ